MVIKTTSENKEPKSKKIAAFIPLVILVSIRVKKTGPIAKASINP